MKSVALAHQPQVKRGIESVEIAGAITEFVLSTVLFGFAGLKALEQDWKMATVAAIAGGVLLFLGLDLLYGWIG